MKFNLLISKIILWLLEFEIAFTPKNAKHYACLKIDRLYWQGQVNKYSLRCYGGFQK